MSYLSFQACKRLMMFVWTAWWNALPRLSQFYHDIKTKSEDIEYLKCHGGWITIYNGIVRISLVAQNFVWKESMKRQKALNRISYYHDAIENSMNNNVFIYVLIQEKDKFPRCKDLFKTEIFTPICLTKLSSSDHLEALIPIKRLGSS